MSLSAAKRREGKRASITSEGKKKETDRSGNDSTQNQELSCKKKTVTPRKLSPSQERKGKKDKGKRSPLGGKKANE